jgi:hypothetical protein
MSKGFSPEPCRSVVATSVFAIILLASNVPLLAVPIVFSAAGANTTDIQATVDAFRNAVGPLNPNDPTPFATGRREINWDAVPNAQADPNPFPANFFNGTTPGRARGLQLSTPGTGFLVSSTAASGQPTNFGFPADFRAFSQERLFSPTGSTITDITFFLPGTMTPAGVSAFGAVFSDVEVLGSTVMSLFDPNGSLLFSQSVLAASTSGGFSFLGVIFNAGETIGRVRLVSGNSVLLSNGSFGPGSDGVVMDDFIYGEPHGTAAVPEGTSSVLLLGLGVLALFAFSGRRAAALI